MTGPEETLQQMVIDLAHICGWKCAHFRPALTKHGWRTPVSADGKGWPDLVLVRDIVIYRELKADGGKLSEEQTQWLVDLRAAGQDAAVWRPNDWPTIQATLTRRRSRPQSASQEFGA